MQVLSFTAVDIIDTSSEAAYNDFFTSYDYFVTM